MFIDLGERNIVSGQNIKKGNMLGRGAFGFVYRATATINGNPNAEVAVKMLQPIDPGHDAKTSIIQIYKVNLLCYFMLKIIISFILCILGCNEPMGTRSFAVSKILICF